MHTGIPVGYEVLTRFEGATPDQAFEQARRAGELPQLDRQCIEQSLTLLDRLPEPYYLAVNVSPESLAYYGKVQFAHQLPLEKRKRIVVEISEHSTTDMRVIDRFSKEWHRLAMRVAIDDVGVEHSNVFRIMQVLPDILKLDRSLVETVDTSQVNRSIIDGITTMANRLRTAVVAEGVETRDEMLWLLSLGVSYGQGYFFGFPAPLEHWFPEDS